MKTLVIIGRRWFRRGPGGTYHTAEIIVDGKTIAKTVEQYGYGDQYLETAFQYLVANEFLTDREHYKNGGQEPLWSYCDRQGIAKTFTAIDVARERDL